MEGNGDRNAEELGQRRLYTNRDSLEYCVEVNSQSKDVSLLEVLLLFLLLVLMLY